MQCKFCGISALDDSAAINQLHPAYVGFVFWEPSKRAVSPEEAQQLRDALDSDIATVGVFVDAPIDVLNTVYSSGIISIAQLHGSEDEAYIAQVRAACPGVEVWKAFLVRDEADIDAANASSADKVVLDAGRGAGETFNWELLAGIKRDYVLAGGLSVETIGALATPSVNSTSSSDTTSPADSTFSTSSADSASLGNSTLSIDSTFAMWGSVRAPSILDVSSGIEGESCDARGRPRKDFMRMKAFLEAAERLGEDS